MTNRLSIITLTCILLLAAGCAHKKKITPTQTPVQQPELTEEQIAIQEQEALRLQEAIRQQEAIERQRIQDSIAQAQAEAERKARIQTLNISRMTLTFSMQGKQLTTPAVMRWQRGEGALVSIQPFAGLEMARIELGKQDVTIIDKINRRYTRLTYDELSQMGARTSIDEIDNWVDNNIIARQDEPQLTLQASRANITGKAVIYTSAMQTNANVNLRPTNVESYRRVTLEQLVKDF